MYISCPIKIYNKANRRDALSFHFAQKQFIMNKSIQFTASSMHYLLTIPNMTPVLTTQDGLKYGERNTDQCVQNMFNTRAVPSSNTLAPTIARQCLRCAHT